MFARFLYIAVKGTMFKAMKCHSQPPPLGHHPAWPPPHRSTYVHVYTLIYAILYFSIKDKEKIRIKYGELHWRRSSSPQGSWSPCCSWAWQSTRGYDWTVNWITWTQVKHHSTFISCRTTHSRALAISIYIGPFEQAVSLGRYPFPDPLAHSTKG